MVDFMREISVEAEFSWTRVPISEDSDKFGSSCGARQPPAAPRLCRAEDPTALGRGRYTACAHSVALNETDLCIANLWLTSQRLLIHPAFTATVYTDEFVLVVNTLTDVDWVDKIAMRKCSRSLCVFFGKNRQPRFFGKKPPLPLRPQRSAAAQLS